MNDEIQWPKPGTEKSQKEGHGWLIKHHLKPKGSAGLDVEKSRRAEARP